MAGLIEKALKLRTRAEESGGDIPALISAAERAVKNIVHGPHAQKKTGGSEEFWQFREYMPGDRPQDIDWRQSAKTQRVYIRQKEWHNTQDNIFWCSAHEGMRFSSGKNPTKADVANILTLGLALLMTRGGERVALMDQGFAARSENTLEALANDLVSAVHNGTLPAPSRAISKNSSIILAGDFLSDLDEMENSFATLAALSENGLVVQILDPAELNLPYNGRVLFEGFDNQAQENVQNVNSIRGQYQERIALHIRSVKELCRDYGWHYVLHRSDQTITETLQAIWLEMSR